MGFDCRKFSIDNTTYRNPLWYLVRRQTNSNVFSSCFEMQQITFLPSFWLVNIRSEKHALTSFGVVLGFFVLNSWFEYKIIFIYLKDWGIQKRNTTRKEGKVNLFGEGRLPWKLEMKGNLKHYLEREEDSRGNEVLSDETLSHRSCKES